jgi:uncharacterized protein (DUF362 family)
MKINNFKRIFSVVAICLMLVSLVIQGGRFDDSDIPLRKLKRTLTGDSLAMPVSIVSVVKSDKASASDIEYEEIKSLVSSAVENAGGFEDLINDGDVVILKPNLISDYDMTNNPQNLPPEVNGMTTDWRVAQATVELVRQYNPNGQVYILEGVANGTTSGNMASLKYLPNFISGVDDFIHLEDRSGEWREWESEYLVKVFLPAGVGLYPDSKKPNNSPEFYLNKIYYEADVIISLPVLKNHSQTNTTLSIKNVGIGTTPTNIYGGIPGDNHRFINNTIDHISPYYLHRFIHDYFLCKPVDFVIIDGLQGSSDGPVGQTGANLADVQENMRLILASKDPIAVDAVASLIMGYIPEKVRHILLLHNTGAGCADPAFIRVNGLILDDEKKVFTNGIQNDIYGYYSDFEGPTMTINSSNMQNSYLHLDLSVEEETIKVEASSDGEFIEEYAISDFDNITLNLSHLGPGNHTIKIHAYDRYLNSTIEEIDVVVGVSEDMNTPVESFELLQNYPNPFNPTTKIPYTISKADNITLTVFDELGRLVESVVDKYHTPGGYEAIFNGQGKPSGVYFYTLDNGKSAITKSMIILK